MNKLKKNRLFNKLILVIISIFLGISLITFNYFKVGRSAIIGGLDSALNLSLSCSGDALWEVESRKINCEVKSEKGTCSTTKEGTLTIEYIGTGERDLSFEYAVSSTREIKIDGKNITSDGSFNKKMMQNERISIFVKSTDASNATKINITNIKLGIDKNITLTFLPSENGTYKLNGTEIIEKYEYITKANIDFELSAIPNDGYKFVGWSFNDKIVSSETPFKSNYTEDAIVKCIFINKDSAVFSNSNKTFYDLQEAIDSANNSDDKDIILKDSCTIFNDDDTEINYDFNGVNLIIPSSSYFSNYGEPAFVANKISKETKCYKKLIIDNNVHLNFNNESKLVIDIKFINAASGGQAGGGSPQGDYGEINLAGENSKIILNSGSHLYAYGYITGSGIVEAKSGSNVVELFQINDFRGGSITSRMKNKVFPFNQYYVQNIECNFRIYSGSTVEVKTALYASNNINLAEFIFISDSKGLFKLSNNGILRRYYNGSSDEICYELEQGTSDISNISLKVAGISVDSSNYVLPITNNMELKIKFGSTVNVNQDLCLLPGSKISIEDGGTLNINEGKKVYLYDKNNWIGKKYAYGNDLDEIVFSPSKKYTRTNNDLINVRFDINGKLNISNEAGIFTTYNSNNYANVYSSSGTGEIYYNGTPVNEEVTYQYNGDTENSIPIQQLALRNSKNEVESSSDTYLFLKNEGSLTDSLYYFDNDQSKWIKKDNTIKTYKITFIDSDKTVTKEYATNADFKFPTSNDDQFKKFLYNDKYTVKKWRIENSGIYDSGVSYKLTTTRDLLAIAIYGGWYTDIDNKSKYYLDYDDGELYKGLKKVETSNKDDVEICYFDENNGLFKEDYTSTYLNQTDNKYYFINNGVVQENGFYKYLDSSNNYNYVFVNNANTLLVDINNYYIDVSNLNNSILPSGYYSFDKSGLIKKEDTNTNNYNGDNVYITNIDNKGDSTYINGIRVSYGLFISDNHYKYSNKEGYIVKSGTYYVSNISNINNQNNIKEGLYYFDENGYMYDEEFNIIEVN